MNIDNIVDEAKGIEAMNAQMQRERAMQGGTGRPFNGPIDDVIGAGDADAVAREINDRKTKEAASGYVDPRSLDSIASSDNVASLESAIAYGVTQRGKEGYVDPRSLDSIASSDNVASLEGAIAYGVAERAKQGYVSQGSLDNVAASDDVAIVEAMVRGVANDNAARGQINERSPDNVAVSGSYDKYASIRKIIESADAREYFPQLAANPTIFDPKAFKLAVTGGIRAYDALDDFFKTYIENLSSTITAASKGVQPQEGEPVDYKQTISGFLNVYSNLIYELKVQDAASEVFDRVKFPMEIKDDLLSAQKTLCEPGEVFSMPVPGRVPGTEYKPMEVMGDAASVINYTAGITDTFIGRVIGQNPNYIPPQQDAAGAVEMGATE